MMITPASIIADPALLAPAFAGDSWATWHAILKAAYAEPLSADDLARFRAISGDRDPPRRRVRELVVIAGRRSGKDSIASAISTAAALSDYRRYLRPGERASVLCLAVDREQAKIVHRYIGGYFSTIPLLQPLVERETDDGLELTNGVEIIVATNSFRSVRGRSICCAIFDEAAFWRSEDSSNPDVEVYGAIMPGMVTLPGAILVIITTAYRRSGLAFDKYAASFGQPDDDVLVVYGPSTTFNPLLPQSIIDAALARDPEAAAAEWLSQWRSDLSDFIDRQLIDTAVDRGIIVRSPKPGTQYVCFVDPSGGRHDSFAMSIAHAEGNIVIVDLVYEKRAPFNPDEPIAEVAEIVKGYGVHDVFGDDWGAGLTVAAFQQKGLRYLPPALPAIRDDERKRLNKSEVYLNCLPLFTAGRLRLPEHQRGEQQFISLERRARPGGRDVVDHPKNSNDDVANVIAGAAVLAAGDDDPGHWRGIARRDAEIAAAIEARAARQDRPPYDPIAIRAANAFATRNALARRNAGYLTPEAHERAAKMARWDAAWLMGKK